MGAVVSLVACSWDRKGVTKKHTSYVEMLMLSHLFAIGVPDKMFLHIFVCFFFRWESRGKYVLYTISEIEYSAFQKERPDSSVTFFLYCDGTCLPKEILPLVSLISLSLTSLPQKTICVLPERHANNLEPCLVWHTHTHWYILWYYVHRKIIWLDTCRHHAKVYIIHVDIWTKMQSNNHNVVMAVFLRGLHGLRPRIVS